MIYTILGIKNKPMGVIDSSNLNSLDFFYQLIQSEYPKELKNEFLEILTPQGNKTGKIKLRDVIHQEGDWHGVFYLNIFSQDNGRLYLLLQKRKHDKKVCPNKLDSIVAGHYVVGEIIEGGVREVKEEIGLPVRFEDLTFLGKRRMLDVQPENNLYIHQIQDIFAYRCDYPLEKYTLQEEELAGILKVNLTSFISLMKRKIDIIRNNGALMLDYGNLKKTRIDVTRDDFMFTHPDDYFLKIAMSISSLSEGKEIPKDAFNFLKNYLEVIVK